MLLLLRDIRRAAVADIVAEPLLTGCVACTSVDENVSWRCGELTRYVVDVRARASVARPSVQLHTCSASEVTAASCSRGSRSGWTGANMISSAWHARGRRTHNTAQPRFSPTRQYVLANRKPHSAGTTRRSVADGNVNTVAVLQKDLVGLGVTRVHVVEGELLCPAERYDATADLRATESNYQPLKAHVTCAADLSLSKRVKRVHSESSIADKGRSSDPSWKAVEAMAWPGRVHKTCN